MLCNADLRTLRCGGEGFVYCGSGCTTSFGCLRYRTNLDRCSFSAVRIFAMHHFQRCWKSSWYGRHLPLLRVGRMMKMDSLCTQTPPITISKDRLRGSIDQISFIITPFSSCSISPYLARRSPSSIVIMPWPNHITHERIDNVGIHFDLLAFISR